MSLAYCHKHGCTHDTDFEVECPQCACEPDAPAVPAPVAAAPVEG